MRSHHSFQFYPQLNCRYNLIEPKEMTMSPQPDFPLVFEKLKSILKPYETGLNITADTPEAYSLDGPYSEKWKKELFFGSAHIKKNYVSFYLMPVYMYPDLLR